MRKFFILFSILFLFICCSDNKQETKDNQETNKHVFSDSISFETIKYDIKKEKLPLRFDFKADIFIPTNNNNLRDSIISNILGTQFIQFNNKNILEIYADSSFNEFVNLFSKSIDYRDYNIEFIKNISGKAKCINENILSYNFEQYNYISDAAHGLTNSINYIFEIKTGKILNEKDIFIPNYYRKVQKLLIQQANLLRVKSLLPYDDEIFNNSLIKPNNNISISDSSIIYTFNPYEIAPYSYGIIDIEIPKEQIINLLDTTSIVYTHLKKEKHERKNKEK